MYYYKIKKYHALPRSAGTAVIQSGSCSWRAKCRRFAIERRARRLDRDSPRPPSSSMDTSPPAASSTSASDAPYDAPPPLKAKASSPCSGAAASSSPPRDARSFATSSDADETASASCRARSTASRRRLDCRFACCARRCAVTFLNDDALTETRCVAIGGVLRCGCGCA